MLWTNRHTHTDTSTDNKGRLKLAVHESTDHIMAWFRVRGVGCFPLNN